MDLICTTYIKNLFQTSSEIKTQTAVFNILSETATFYWRNEMYKYCICNPNAIVISSSSILHCPSL